MVDSGSHSNEHGMRGGRAMRIFAIFATMIMLLTGFQILVGAAIAQVDGPIDPIETEKGTNGSASDPILPTPKTPTEDVQVFGSAKSIVVSDAGPILIQSRMHKDENTITYVTGYGDYIIDESAPETLSLRSDNGAILVRESYFTIDYAGIIAIPCNGIVLSSDDDNLVIDYSLIQSRSSPNFIGRMELSINFSDCKPPKITADVLNIDSKIMDWRVVWQIAVADDSNFMLNGSRNNTIPIGDFANKCIPCDSLSAMLMSSNGGKSSSLTVNWSDAKEGNLSVSSVTLTDGSAATAMIVSFQPGKNTIDPIMVATSTENSATSLTWQRKTFNYNGYFWIFYNNGNSICYRNSGDGITWDSEISMPGSTVPSDGTGFDVAQRGNSVAVGWYTSGTVRIKNGTIIGGKIVWNPSTPPSFSDAKLGTVSVAIGTDYTFWIAYYATRTGQTNITVRHSFDGMDFPIALDTLCYGWYYTPAIFDHYSTLMPTANGNVTLLEKADGSSGTHHYVRVRYYWNARGGGYGWGSPNDFYIDSMGDGNENNFSAVSTMNGTIHIGYKLISGYLAYGYIYPGSQSYSYASVNQSISGSSCPTICIDSNDIVHIFYILKSGSTWSIKHIQRIGQSAGSWSSPDMVYSLTDSNVEFRGLTSWINPVETVALAFTNSTSTTKKVMFISTPLPYGTSGSSVDPWSRDGLSPYGTYFGSGGASVSPGSGQLFIQQMDVSVPGRGGMDIGISRIYQQPRYFCNSNGSPYLSGGYPFCNLGPYWSLDLPWMSQEYVCIGGGMRFVIQWGNTGDSKAFENHGGTHFILRNVTMGATKFFELTMSSGLRYRFDSVAPFKLLSISDLKGYNPLASTYTNPYNCLNFSYNSNNRLVAIYEAGMNRSILFEYNANGLLSYITRPDGLKVDLVYYPYGGMYYLYVVADPKDRVTTYDYNSSANYLIKTITYPTGAKSEYTYSKDNTSATECFSWFVTKEILKNSSGGVLIRQTNVSYKIINGKVTFAKLTNLDENSAIASYTEYIFRSNLKYTSTTTKNSTGGQMQCKLTYYDASGQPARIDTMKGGSQSVNYSEYMSYDDWGNVIFTRNALGHAVYSSYANTSTQNSFQGGDILTRNSTGKMLYDAFDDWDFSDWTQYIDPPNTTASLDGTKDPPSAPSLKLKRIDGHPWTDCYIIHAFAPQAGNFYIQQSFNSAVGDYNRIFVCSGNDDNLRVYLRSYGGKFQYKDGSNYFNVADCVQNVWYDVGFYLRTDNKYDIYIDGTCVKTGAPMQGTSGNFDRVRYYAGERALGDSAELYVDNIRIYKNLTIKINNLNSKYMAELYDGSGCFLNRSKTGTITIPKLLLNAPPAYIRIWKIGDYSYSTPMMDIWGGDVYYFNPGVSKSNVMKNLSSFGFGDNKFADEDWPSGSSYCGSGPGEGYWANDPGSAVGGNKYHLSNYSTSIHWHGYTGSSETLPIYQTQVFKTYIWLSYGMIPKEIMLQFYFGEWRRAYWGGNDSNGADLMGNLSGFAPTLSVRMGDVPQVTGKWIELSVGASNLSLSGWKYINGVIYGLYGGTAKWDFVCRYSKGIYVEDVPIGSTVQMKFDDGPTVSQTVTSNCTILNPSASGINTWPNSGYFKVSNSTGSLLYVSPHITDIYNWDKFKYSTPDFYPNQVKDLIHNRMVGMFQYRDTANTTSEESYMRYDFEGNANETKSKNSSDWIYTQGGYDKYGNQLWTSDPSGRMSLTEYSSTYSYTYPISTSYGGRKEVFEFDTSWESTISSGDESWMNAEYATAKSYSPTHSLEVSFTGAQSGESGTADVSRDYVVNPVATISVRMYVSQYSHSHEVGEVMDSGIKMLLFDSNGVNYDTYSYWLACWSQTVDNRTSSDPNVKVICGKPLNMSTWISRVLHPNTDWPNINWTRCDKVEFQLYVNVVNAYGDVFKAYYDDFTYDDFTNNTKTTYTYDTKTGAVLSERDPLGHETIIRYDALGRVTLLKTPTMPTTTVTFRDDTCYGGDLETTGASWDAVYNATSATTIHPHVGLCGGANKITYYVLHHGILYFDTSSIPDDVVVINASIALSVFDKSATNFNAVIQHDQTDTRPSTPSIYADYDRLHYSGSDGYTANSAFTKEKWGTIFLNVSGTNWIKKTELTKFVVRSGFDVNGINGIASGYNFLEWIASNWSGKESLRPMLNVTYCLPDITIYNDYYNTVTTLDSLGHKTIQYFDGIGRMIKVQRYNSSSSDLYSTEYYTYNWQDKVKTFKDALGSISYSYYDCLGRAIKLTNPDGAYQTITYNDQASTVTLIDENGNMIVKVYDDLGRLNTTKEYNRKYTQYSASFRDDVGTALRTTSNSWYASWSAASASSIEIKGEIGVCPSGWQIFRTAQLFDTSSLPDDCIITDAYMAIKVWDKTSQSFDLIVQHDPTNDRPSNPVDLTDYNKSYYSGEGGNLSNSLIVDDTWNRVYLNAAGQSWIDKTGTTKFMVRASFDINNQSQASGAYVLWYTAPWTESRRVRLNVTYILPGDYTICCYETKMAYDAVGNLLTVKASNGEVTRMYYDTLNRLTQTIYPDGQNESATYDDSGNTVSKTARSDQTARSAYDSSGKLFRTKSLNDTISYLFDSDGKTIETRNNCTTVNYSYNGCDQLKSMSEVITGTHNMSYGYDVEGKIAWVKYPNQVNISYGYDVFDRLVGVEKNGSRLLWLYYNADDTVSKEVTAGGQVTNYTYNSRGWVSKIETKNGGSIVLSMNYTYDGVGNVKTINYAPSVTESYSYDNLSRLVRADGSETWGAVINYVYDSVGNRLWKNESGSTAYTYGSYNKLTSDGTWSYTYGRGGDLIWKNSTSAKYNYTFNSLGQMTNAYKWVGQDRTTLGSYYYDVNGARAKTIEGAKTTEYVYAGHDPVCEMLGDRYTDYVYVNGHMKFKIAGDYVYSYIGDVLGSTRLVFNGSVKTFSVATYKPFGIACGTTGSEKFTFAGEMNDSTGLFYLFARYFDPETGRFISPDPLLGQLSSPQTLNRYVYCTNNPLIYTDPAGTKTGRSGSNFKWEPMSEADFQAYWDSIPVEEPSGWLEQMADLAFTAISFIPVVGNIVSTAYFVAKDIVRGDWGSLALDLATAFIPGGKALKGFGKGLGIAGKEAGRVVDAAELIGRTGTYKELRSMVKAVKKSGGDTSNLQVHHLVEKRFADLFKMKSSNMPSVILTKQEHQQYTNKWLAEIGRGSGTEEASRGSVLSSARTIYAGNTEWLNLISRYFP